MVEVIALHECQPGVVCFYSCFPKPQPQSFSYTL